MATTTLTWDGVSARRMARQSLTMPATGRSPADVVGVMGGAHAQILTAAEVSIARRLAGATRAEVQRALWDDRTLVKTFGPRGTVHLLPTADLPMWTGALSALPSSVPQHPEPVRFTAAQDKWPRWRQLTSTAAHRGVLCFGANKGRQATYTNPHRWLRGLRPDDGEAALRTLVRRYLHAYGPATPQHFAKWLNITPRRASELFAELAPDLEQVSFDGTPSWVVAGDTLVSDEPARGVRLLPYFDAYVVAAQPRERLYPGAAGTRGLTPTGQAGNYPVVLVDGVVGGIWHQRRSGRKLSITLEPLGTLTKTHRRELDDEVALVAAIEEATPTLTIGTVTVGPHA